MRTFPCARQQAFHSPLAAHMPLCGLVYGIPVITRAENRMALEAWFWVTSTIQSLQSIIDFFFKQMHTLNYLMCLLKYMMADSYKASFLDSLVPESKEEF